MVDWNLTELATNQENTPTPGWVFHELAEGIETATPEEINRLIDYLAECVDHEHAHTKLKALFVIKALVKRNERFHSFVHIFHVVFFRSGSRRPLRGRAGAITGSLAVQKMRPDSGVLSQIVAQSEGSDLEYLDILDLLAVSQGLELAISESQTPLPISAFWNKNRPSQYTLSK